MQVVCKSTQEAAEIHCSVCGQGFALIWEQQSKIERAEAMRAIDKAMRSHHWNQGRPGAHPVRCFTVETSQEPIAASGHTTFGYAPRWAL